jgi:hypothetical protein
MTRNSDPHVEPRLSAQPCGAQPMTHSSPENADLLTLHEWMREPDLAESFSLREMLDWIDRRPTHITARLPISAQCAPWQPIETAPKDRPILLCVIGYLPCTGRWWPLDKCWTSFDWDGHFETDEELSAYVNGTSYEPTHWQPLPPGPSSSSPERRIKLGCRRCLGWGTIRLGNMDRETCELCHGTGTDPDQSELASPDRGQP